MNTIYTRVSEEQQKRDATTVGQERDARLALWDKYYKRVSARYSQRDCTSWLLGRSCARTKDVDRPCWHGDHTSFWVDRETGERVVIAQPYNFSWDGTGRNHGMHDDLEALIAVCQRHGFRFDLAAWNSFHYPAHTFAVVIRMASK